MGFFENLFKRLFGKGEPAAESSFYVPASAIGPKDEAAKPPAWFLRADFNGDGDVSRREFLGSGGQFTRLDANRDGYLEHAEVAGFQSEDDGEAEKRRAD